LLRRYAPEPVEPEPTEKTRARLNTALYSACIRTTVASN
jgi:hypothetical protein